MYFEKAHGLLATLPLSGTQVPQFRGGKWNRKSVNSSSKTAKQLDETTGKKKTKLD